MGGNRFFFGPDTSVGIADILSKTGDLVETPVWGKMDLGSCIYEGLHCDGKIIVPLEDQRRIERNSIGGKLQEIYDRIYGLRPDLTTKELKAFLHDLYEIMKSPEEQRDAQIRLLFSKIKGFDLNKLPDSPIKDMETAIRVLAPNITEDDVVKIISLGDNLGDPGSFERKKEKPTRYSSRELPLPWNEVLIHPTKNKVLGIILLQFDCDDYFKDKKEGLVNEALEFQKYIEDNGGPHLPIFRYTPGKLTLLEE